MGDRLERVSRKLAAECGPDDDEQQHLTDNVQPQHLSILLCLSFVQVLDDLADDERCEKGDAELLTHVLVDGCQAIPARRSGLDEAPTIALLEIHREKERSDESA